MENQFEQVSNESGDAESIDRVRERIKKKEAAFNALMPCGTFSGNFLGLTPIERAVYESDNARYYANATALLNAHRCPNCQTKMKYQGFHIPVLVPANMKCPKCGFTASGM